MKSSRSGNHASTTDDQLPTKIREQGTSRHERTAAKEHEAQSHPHRHRHPCTHARPELAATTPAQSTRRAAGVQSEMGMAVGATRSEDERSDAAESGEQGTA
ncbi:uncharacterized protein PSANT_06654 [Moesziomyces antarcticus]|uniref:Uncharacterized protein n=1 Tax=Pseudozyma antarctica TaxID=84753 RepID=A0A5C3FXB2_PSEA2|nr:uncharacterized protein PSANT_06654 [Moesziomyces antarcticus]